jgi:hypothetical protein
MPKRKAAQKADDATSEPVFEAVVTLNERDYRLRLDSEGEVTLAVQPAGDRGTAEGDDRLPRLEGKLIDQIAAPAPPGHGDLIVGSNAGHLTAFKGMSDDEARSALRDFTDRALAVPDLALPDS